jgi:hypothetical protein
MSNPMYDDVSWFVAPVRQRRWLSGGHVRTGLQAMIGRNWANQRGVTVLGLGR